MKVGIDIRCLVNGRRTGVEEYTINLLKNIFELDNKNEYVLFYNSFQEPKSQLDWLEKYKNVSIKKFRFPNKLLNFCFWYLGWPKIDEMIGGVDVFFYPNIIFGATSKKSKVVLTMHDLSFERYEGSFSFKRRLWHLLINPKKSCIKANKIIAVSDSTKNDLVDLYKIDQEKIKLIHSAIDDDFQIVDRNDAKLLEIKNKYELPYKFILYFGTIEPRKNIIGIIRAFNQLQDFAKESSNEEMSKYDLVLAGERGWLSDSIYKEIKKSKYENKIKLIVSVLNDDKKYIFNLASLFVYPSFFEGFGFPPLEAMTCGVPVIVSNNSSLPEIVDDAAIMIDPHKPDEIFQAMKSILESRKMQEKLCKRGLQQAAKFRWQKTAKEFLKIIRE